MSTTFRAGLPDGEPFALRHIVIVSAYGGQGFFTELARQLRPQKVDAVLDQGVPVELVQHARARLGRRLRSVRLARAPHLMHAKVYYLRWTSPDRARDIHILHWGSANASASAFASGFDGSEGNAECMAWARIFPGTTRHRPIFDWLRGIVESEGTSSVAAKTVSLGQGIQLSLPCLRLEDAKAALSFDAWLQRGRLCHKYEVDPSFLRLTVQLKNPLPNADVARVLSDAELVPDSGPRQLRWNYLHVCHDTEKTHVAWNWRARHFIDSNIGYWTSAACFDVHKDSFTASNTERRRTELQLVMSTVIGHEDEWVERLLEKINGVFDEFETTERGEYFYMSAGRLDVDRYRGPALRQLILDGTKSRDAIFQDQYIRRFVFPRVPWFQADRESWEDFAVSVAKAIWLQIQKSRVSNAMARVVRDDLHAMADGGESVVRSDELLTYLRENWHSLGPMADEALVAGATATSYQA